MSVSDARNRARARWRRTRGPMQQSGSTPDRLSCAGEKEHMSVILRCSLSIAMGATVAGFLASCCVAHAGTTDMPRVAIVFDHHSYMDSPRGEGPSAVTYMNTVRQALDAVGVRYVVLSDLTVERAGLGCHHIAIFPHNFAVPDRSRRQLSAMSPREATSGPRQVSRAGWRREVGRSRSSGQDQTARFRRRSVRAESLKSTGG
jgi:hypothetical protein